MIFGVDTHAGYGAIDAAKLKAAGCRFVYAKCTEGDQGNGLYVDPQFAATVASCREHGIAVGAYHFAFPLSGGKPRPPELAVGDTPEEQVEFAWRNSAGLGSVPGDLSPVVDAEWPAPEDFDRWGITRESVSRWLRRYCELATKRWGRAPVIYTYPSWWRWLAAGADVSWAKEYHLWFADYGWPGEGTPPDGWAPPHMGWVASTWDDWAICQFSADGSTVRVPGINACPVDRNIIRSETMLNVLRWLDDRGAPCFPIVHPWHFTDEPPPDDAA